MEWLGFLAGAILAIPLALLVLFTWHSSPRYRGAPSEHFDGRWFRNLEPTGHPFRPAGMTFLWKVVWSHWAEEENPPPTPVRERLPGGELAVTWVNHATALIQVGPWNVLTDPVWDRYCGPLPMDFCRRRRSPGLELEDLPPIDLVVLSHDHWDHCSLPTLRWLHDHHDCRFLVGLGDRALLERAGIGRVEELDWWQGRDLGEGRRATYVPALHTSGRGLTDRDTSLWGGWFLEAPGGPVYFAGDTGFAGHFREIRERLGAPRLALLPIGAFQPRWFMKTMHTSPEEAVRAHLVLEAEASLAIHHGTFPLAADEQHEPREAFEEALAHHGVSPEAFRILPHGIRWQLS